MAKLKVAVLFGGVSSEYEVSLMSAASVIDNLSADEFEVIKIGITKNGRWLLYPGDTDGIRDGSFAECPDAVPAFISPDRAIHGLIKLTDDGASVQKLDVVFPVLHGKNGEDGTVQGLLELAGIPYVGCGVLASAACMDKAFTNIITEACGVPHTPWAFINLYDRSSLEERLPEYESELGYPIFVKPANAGSSIGITKAHERAQLRDAVNLAFTYDDKVVLEKAVVGKELECAVLGNGNELFASEVTEILPRNEFYDYEAKYINASETELPANISDELRLEVQEMAKKAYSALGCAGLARVDFLYDEENGRLMLNEPNTLPGFTSISMYPQMMEKSGVPYGELLSRLIVLAVESHR